MHECCCPSPQSCQSGEANHKAGAGHGCFAVFAERADAVLSPDLAAMGLDDLLGDRQAQPRILAEALMWPVGIKTFEDPRERVLANARSIIVDDDFHVRAHATARDPHLAAGLRERLGV